MKRVCNIDPRDHSDALLPDKTAGNSPNSDGIEKYECPKSKCGKKFNSCYTLIAHCQSFHTFRRTEIDQLKAIHFPKNSLYRRHSHSQNLLQQSKKRRIQRYQKRADFKSSQEDSSYCQAKTSIDPARCLKRREELENAGELTRDLVGTEVRCQYCQSILKHQNSLSRHNKTDYCVFFQNQQENQLDKTRESQEAGNLKIDSSLEDISEDEQESVDPEYENSAEIDPNLESSFMPELEASGETEEAEFPDQPDSNQVSPADILEHSFEQPEENQPEKGTKRENFGNINETEINSSNIPPWMPVKDEDTRNLQPNIFNQPPKALSDNYSSSRCKNTPQPEDTDIPKSLDITASSTHSDFTLPEDEPLYDTIVTSSDDEEDLVFVSAGEKSSSFEF